MPAVGRAMLFLSCLLQASTLCAQQSQIVLERAPYYIDHPVLMRIVVQGFDEEPSPTVDIESTPPELSVQLASIAPQVSSSVRIMSDPQTGRMRKSVTKTVVYSIYHRITARRPGRYTVGPFVIQQNGKEVRAQAVTLTFQDVAIDPDARIRLVLPDKPMYPDQRVPVSVEFWYAGDFGNINELNICSPLFDQFTFAEDPRPTRNSSILPIQTKDGKLGLVADARRENVEGKPFTILSATRIMIPDRPGEFPLAPIMATTRKVTKWARARSPFDDSFFGGGMGGSLLEEMMGDRRRPAASELVRAVGQPRTLTVKPFPAENRPESFAGAVGSNFSLDVTAARTEVHVGDPITLNLTLRGAGNIDNAGLPPLSADGGMDSERFRLPETDISGRIEGGAKRFDVSIRVKDETVNRVPAIAYSWFDPDTETYHTTRSKPIALNVMPAKIVSSADVISSRTKSPRPPAGKSDSGGDNEESQPRSGAPSFTLSGADLSIEPNARILFRDSRSRRGGVAVQVGLYIAGLLLIGLAVLGRKRSDIPPEILRRRQRLRRQRQRIEKTRGQPQQKAAEEVAASLRAMIAEMPNVSREEVDAVVVECEAVAYAPTDLGSDALDNLLLHRALAVADQIIKEAE
ncbi:MAG: hypothetical protein ACC628_16845 [Pirellulaceae bacterium]